MDAKQALQEFIKKAKERYGARVRKIVLFGSYARGDYGKDSDIDILVIGDVSLDELIDVSFPLLLKYGIYISPHPMTERHFSLLEKEGYGFAKNVKKEGKVVYA